MTTQTQNTFVTVTEFRQAIAELKARVTGLENLANRLGYAVDVPEVESVPESVSDTNRPSVRVPVSTEFDTSSVPNDYDDSDRDVHGRPSGVDYGAVAYGLTSLRDKIARQFNVSGAFDNSTDLGRQYVDTVAWFASCFQGDASFNEAEFRRNAGV